MSGPFPTPAAPQVPGQSTDLTTTNTTLLQLVQALNNLTTELIATVTAGNADLAAINTTLSTVFPARILTGSKTFDPPSIANGASTTTTVTVTGAILGNRALASFSLDTTGVALAAQVTAANTVTVIFLNLTGGAVDLASGTLAVTVFG